MNSFNMGRLTLPHKLDSARSLSYDKRSRPIGDPFFPHEQLHSDHLIDIILVPISGLIPMSSPPFRPTTFSHLLTSVSPPLPIACLSFFICLVPISHLPSIVPFPFTYFHIALPLDYFIALTNPHSDLSNTLVSPIPIQPHQLMVACSLPERSILMNTTICFLFKIRAAPDYQSPFLTAASAPTTMILQTFQKTWREQRLAARLVLLI